MPLPSISMRRRTAVQLILAGLLLLGSAGRPAAAAPAPPVVVYRVETAAARGLATACAELWEQAGPRLAADILPAGVAADTVQCWILTSDRFDELFGGRLPDWGVGVALPPGRIVALDHERIRNVGPGPRAVFLHEMAHALLFQAADGVPLPTWLHEGVAMSASGEWRFTDTVGVVLSGRLPSLASLSGAFPQSSVAAQRAYRTSLLAVRWLESRHGPDAVRRILAAVRRHGSWHAGFLEATGESPATFASRFAGAMRLRYGWVLMLFRWPTLFVLMAVLFLVGAVVKVARNRRALAREAAAEDARELGRRPGAPGDGPWRGGVPPDAED